MDEGVSAALMLAVTVLVNIGLAGMVGSGASITWLRRAASPWGLTAQARSRLVLRMAVVFTAFSTVLLLWLQAASMAEVPLLEAWTALPTVLMQTHVGHAWVAGLIGLIVVLGASAGQPNSNLGQRLSGVLAGICVFIYSRGAASHAGAHGAFSLSVLIESGHLLVISLWAGALYIAAFAILARGVGQHPADRLDASRWIQTLSTAATWSLLAIVLTGLFNAWRGLGSLPNLVGSVYGKALLVKVGLVSVAVALGGINRLLVMPRLLGALQSPHVSSEQPQRSFVRVLRCEALVLLAALVAAALLSASPLPGAI